MTIAKEVSVVAAIAAALCFSGCSDERVERRPGRLHAVTPEVIVSAPAGVHTVKVEVVSELIPGALGGKGVRKPLPGIKVVATTEEGLSARPLSETTDRGGEFVFEVTTGDAVGDAYLVVACEGAPNVSKRFRFANGVEILNAGQEVAAGKTSAKPLQVRLTDGSGAPAVGIPVHFSIVSQPGEKGRLAKAVCLTDAEGIAGTSLSTEAKLTGSYIVSAEIASPDAGWVLRPIHLETMEIAPLSLSIAVLGGLAIFIFGMTLMSEGLQQVAGSRMKQVLGYMTRNRLAAIAAGAVITAIIQSSSATTVMTVGFVNAGLLSLKQAIGVVFGANIGTTITGQLVSFKLTNLAFPAIVIGVGGLLVTKRSSAIRGVAQAVLGFGLLFFGMNLIGDSLADVSAFPSFVKFFRLFDCTPEKGAPMPLLSVLGAVGIGVLTTMAVQSSSATIGLTIALANSGLLSFWTAVPIVLGDNIGTTITAILASINTRVAAKRTALAHAMFNITGTVIMIGLFYVTLDGIPVFLKLVSAVTPGDAFSGENLGRHVAMAHTLFNVGNVVLLTPFIGSLAWFCERVLKGSEPFAPAVKLEPHLLKNPEFALDCVRRSLVEMTSKAWNAAHAVLTGCLDGKPVDVDEIHQVEDEIDSMQASAMDYLVQLTRRRLTEPQAKTVPILMHCVNDAERIADIALLLARRVSAKPVADKGFFSEDAILELAEILKLAESVASSTFNALQNRAKPDEAIRQVAEIKRLSKLSVDNHAARLHSGQCTPTGGFVYVEVLAAIEGIARHMGNIAERA